MINPSGEQEKPSSRREQLSLNMRDIIRYTDPQEHTSQEGFHALSEQTGLVVFIGFTGVGKSTTTGLLDLDLTLLPNRRDLTDDIIIPTVADKEDLDENGKVKDRKLRFEYTRRFREEHRGGMAYVLRGLSISNALFDRHLIFDGIRGENEVEEAAEFLPRARFVMLDSPDVVRIARVAGRQDSFDKIATQSLAVGSDQVELIRSLVAFLTVDEQEVVIRLVNEDAISLSELKKALAIMSEEKLNYDPQKTKQALEQLVPNRSLILDTSASSYEGHPEKVANTVTEFILKTNASN